MKGTDVKCPVCGTVNESLFLEETEGHYECGKCGHKGIVPVQKYSRLAAYDRSLKRLKEEGDSRSGRLKPLNA